MNKRNGIHLGDSKDNVSQYRDLSRYRNSSSSNHGATKGKLVDNFSTEDSAFTNTDNDNLKYKTAQYSRSSNNKYSHKHIKKKANAKRRKRLLRTGIAVFILAVIAVVVWKFFPIKVTINGEEQTLTYDKSVQQAVEQSKIKVNPGNFVAVDFSVLEQGKGENCYIEVNGQEVKDTAIQLQNGDSINYKDGKDKMEEYDSKDSNIVAKSKIVGVGAIHKFNGTGEPGTWSKMKGKISKKYAERQTKEPSNVTCQNVDINPGKDKVIALTFDDGPTEEYTQQILDILKQYNAKATFFCIGERLNEDWAQKIINKEDAAGHQVCTHTYDHARGAGGVDITVMSAEKQIEEVTKGQMMIAQTLGKEASKIVRLPGGNLNAVTCRLIAPYVTAEIGWNIDTTDWQRPGVQVIEEKLNSASNGNVILCHDGGGDRSQTVEAIKGFIKTYTEKGYKFITIDELLKYPEAQQQEPNSVETEDSTSNNNVYGNTTPYSGNY